MVALFFLSVSLGTAVTGEHLAVLRPANEAPYFAVLGLVAGRGRRRAVVLAKPVLKLMRGIR